MCLRNLHGHFIIDKFAYLSKSIQDRFQFASYVCYQNACQMTGIGQAQFLHTDMH